MPSIRCASVYFVRRYVYYEECVIVIATKFKAGLKRTGIASVDTYTCKIPRQCDCWIVLLSKSHNLKSSCTRAAIEREWQEKTHPACTPVVRLLVKQDCWYYAAIFTLRENRQIIKKKDYSSFSTPAIRNKNVTGGALSDTAL
ncbi:uncharacterized protein LOC102808510 [Saccoglossus kowalevskii]